MVKSRRSPKPSSKRTKEIRIGALARATKRSVHTIRWYEEQGLMPGVRRDAGGRRGYTQDHIDWLDLLDRLRRSGMSIKQMQAYAALVTKGVKTKDKRTLEERIALLSQHEQSIILSIDELHAAKALVKAKIAFYCEWRDTGKRPEKMPTVRSMSEKQG